MIFGENRKFSLRAARGKAIESSTNVRVELPPGSANLEFVLSTEYYV